MSAPILSLLLALSSTLQTAAEDAELARLLAVETPALSAALRDEESLWTLITSPETPSLERHAAVVQGRRVLARLDLRRITAALRDLRTEAATHAWGLEPGEDGPLDAWRPGQLTDSERVREVLGRRWTLPVRATASWPATRAVDEDARLPWPLTIERALERWLASAGRSEDPDDTLAHRRRWIERAARVAVDDEIAAGVFRDILFAGGVQKTRLELDLERVLPAIVEHSKSADTSTAERRSDRAQLVDDWKQIARPGQEEEDGGAVLRRVHGTLERHLFGEVSRPPAPLRIDWADNFLVVEGEQLPVGKLRIWYIEAYCRAASHRADWSRHTVVGHRTMKLERSDDGTRLHLRCELSDGVVAEHLLETTHDAVRISIDIHNPTEERSEAHWAQPCVRVGDFTGLGSKTEQRTYTYLARSFIWQDGAAERLPTLPWALDAKYVPGQVWAAPGVSGDDVNPRPLNSVRPKHGLIGCVDEHGKRLLGIAFDPWQELFQGVVTCLHVDFRIGGLEAGERREIAGRLWVLPNAPGLLKRRFLREFPL